MRRKSELDVESGIVRKPSACFQAHVGGRYKREIVRQALISLMKNLEDLNDCAHWSVVFSYFSAKILIFRVMDRILYTVDVGS